MHLYIHKYYLCRHLVPPMPGGVLPAACELMDEVACFSFFMTDSIVDTMLENTNKSIENFKGQLGPDDLETIRTKAPYIKTTTALELKAFMGLLILRGVYKCNYTAVKKFWNSHPVFPATMSLHRFYFLLRYVRFDDFETTELRWPRDRGAAVRDVFEEWNDRLAQAIQTGDVSMFVDL